MARIRTVKPDFFRHEKLQDVESANPGAHVMLVFAALWGHCDKAGRFEWRPRRLKLDILPFLQFDLEATLSVLEREGFIRRYELGGEIFGEVPTFGEHQRISGKEAQESGKCPEPNGYLPIASPGSSGEALETAGKEGKGKEGKGEDAPSAKKYAWVGKVVRLLQDDYDKLKTTYSSIPDFNAELFAADSYYHLNPPKDGKWYFPLSGWLKREHQKHTAGQLRLEAPGGGWSDSWCLTEELATYSRSKIKNENSKIVFEKFQGVVKSGRCKVSNWPQDFRDFVDREAAKFSR